MKKILSFTKTSLWVILSIIFFPVFIILFGLFVFKGSVDQLESI